MPSASETILLSPATVPNDNREGIIGVGHQVSQRPPGTPQSRQDAPPIPYMADRRKRKQRGAHAHWHKRKGQGPDSCEGSKETESVILVRKISRNRS